MWWCNGFGPFTTILLAAPIVTADRGVNLLSRGQKNGSISQFPVKGYPPDLRVVDLEFNEFMAVLVIDTQIVL